MDNSSYYGDKIRIFISRMKVTYGNTENGIETNPGDLFSVTWSESSLDYMSVMKSGKRV